MDEAQTWYPANVETKCAEGELNAFWKTSFMPSPADVRDLIFEHSNGHAGVIRTLLFHLVLMNKRTRDDVLNFASRSFYQSNLGYRTFFANS